MSVDPVERDLMEAETRLARALQRLSALRRAALYGAYDATEFDQAVASYRRAEGDVLEARRAWNRRKDSIQRGEVSIPEPEEISPAEETPRLLFVRWLVNTGRLSDWGGEEDGEKEQSLVRAV